MYTKYFKVIGVSLFCLFISNVTNWYYTIKLNINNPQLDKNENEENLPFFQFTYDEHIINNINRTKSNLLIKYNNKIKTYITGIKYRGSTSIFFPKKSYNVEFWGNDDDDLKVSILNMNSNSDFILHGPFIDRTYMRNKLIYDLTSELFTYQEWAPKSKYVEMSVNYVYKGIYLLIENIKRDKNRVNIESYSKCNKNKPFIAEYGWTSYPKKGWKIVYPKKESDNEKEKNIKSIEDIFNETKGIDIFKIDLNSAVDYFLLNELGNPDAHRLSVFIHKKCGIDKVKIGPVWDFNLAFNNNFGRYRPNEIEE